MKALNRGIVTVLSHLGTMVPDWLRIVPPQDMQSWRSMVQQDAVKLDLPEPVIENAYIVLYPLRILHSNQHQPGNIHNDTIIRQMIEGYVGNLHWPFDSPCVVTNLADNFQQPPDFTGIAESISDAAMEAFLQRNAVQGAPSSTNTSAGAGPSTPAPVQSRLSSALAGFGRHTHNIARLVRLQRFSEILQTQQHTLPLEEADEMAMHLCILQQASGLPAEIMPSEMPYCVPRLDNMHVLNRNSSISMYNGHSYIRLFLGHSDMPSTSRNHPRKRHIGGHDSDSSDDSVSTLREGVPPIGSPLQKVRGIQVSVDAHRFLLWCMHGRIPSSVHVVGAGDIQAPGGAPNVGPSGAVAGAAGGSSGASPGAAGGSSGAAPGAAGGPSGSVNGTPAGVPLVAAGSAGGATGIEAGAEDLGPQMSTCCMHICNNKGCINPLHLWYGTYSLNRKAASQPIVHHANTVMMSLANANAVLRLPNRLLSDELRLLR